MDVVIILVLFGVLGILIGYKIGTTWGETLETSRQYWICNLIAIVAGILFSALIVAIGYVGFSGLAIGLIAGVIAGLKAGFGQSVGIWKKHDTFFRVNKDHLEAAEAAERAKEEGMTAKERAERDLVSVGKNKEH
ncbi:MAG: hypothetical protein IKE43_05110 [Coriobacteriales bacterium]|nr:hypothetical protein [Coriobacteriales bacterium]